MGAINETELKRQLSQGQLSSLYVVRGEEKYLVSRWARRILKAAGGDSFPEFNRNELGSSATVDAIADAAEALPFFSGHKCVSVPDWDPELQDATELSKLQELLENLPETTTLVFWYPTQEPDGRKAKVKNLWKWASQYGQVLECRRRDPSELRKVLLREAEKAGCSLSRENAGKILEYAGLDLHLLLSEMQKLCAYALGTAGENPASPPEITAAMIETLVPKTAEATAFLLANALAAGNFEGAYRHLDTLLTQNQEPIAILGALSSVYVDMYRVKAALESGKPATAPAEYGGLQGPGVPPAQRGAQRPGSAPVRAAAQPRPAPPGGPGPKGL